MAEVNADIKAARRAERERDRPWPVGLDLEAGDGGRRAVVLIAGVIGGYVLRGDDAPERTLIEAEAFDGGARMVVTLEREDDRGILHVEELPALPENRVYQAWLQRDGVMEPSTTFVLDRDGSTDVAVEGDLGGTSGLFITREPEGGSDEPTPPVLMKAPLA